MAGALSVDGSESSAGLFDGTIARDLAVLAGLAGRCQAALITLRGPLAALEMTAHDGPHAVVVVGHEVA